MDSGAKHQLGFFAIASLLLVLMPISISIRDGASVVAQRLAIDAAPWRQSLLPSPLGIVDRAIFILPRPIGTAMPNFADDGLVERDVFDHVAVASLPGKPSEQNRPEPVQPQKIALLIANRFAEFNHEATRSNPELNKTPKLQTQSGPTIIQNGFPSFAPMGHVRFCLQHVEDCKIHGNDFRRRTIALTSERWTELMQVNREVNRDIIPQPDEVGVAGEMWSVHPKVGACYDYAVTKRHYLLARGWPSSALLLSEVVTLWGEHHLVLVVRLAQGNVVLDNLDSNIRTVEMVRYQWVRIQSKSNPKFWLAAIPGRLPSLNDHLGTAPNT